jgi:hypothetical protein
MSNMLNAFIDSPPTISERIGQEIFCSEGEYILTAERAIEEVDKQMKISKKKPQTCKL